MQKAHFLAFFLLLSLNGFPFGLYAKHATSKNPAKFSLIKALENQATQDLYSFGNALNENILKLVKTPKNPNRFEIAVDRFCDAILKWRGSKLAKFGKVCAWSTIVLPVLAGGLALANVGKEEFKLHDHVSRAGYSLTLFALQTYLLEKSGINTKKDLTTQSVIDFIKSKIQKQVSREDEKLEALKKLQRNRDQSPAKTQDELLQQLQAQSDAIVALEKQLAELAHKKETTEKPQEIVHKL